MVAYAHIDAELKLGQIKTVHKLNLDTALYARVVNYDIDAVDIETVDKCLKQIAYECDFNGIFTEVDTLYHSADKRDNSVCGRSLGNILVGCAVGGSKSLVVGRRSVHLHAHHRQTLKVNHNLIHAYAEHLSVDIQLAFLQIYCENLVVIVYITARVLGQ